MDIIMPKTHSQLYIQYVFTVKGRKNFIPEEQNIFLHKYIRGIIEKRKSVLIAINNMPDHIHLLASVNPNYSMAKFIQDVKAGSSKYINDQKWIKGKFQWQSGYGAFSYSKSHIDDVVQYINHQQQHHQNKTFREEYLEFLEKFQVEYEDKYLFEFYD
jgi:REP element-mobilizing transposase RayT